MKMRLALAAALLLLLVSGCVVTSDGVTITVYGTPGNDVIQITQNGATVSATVNGRTWYVSGQKIVVLADGGNDSVVCAQNVILPLTIYGGFGNDTLVGGAGPDKIYGQDNTDTVQGGGGADVLDGGPGVDTILWNSQKDTLITDPFYTDVLQPDPLDPQSPPPPPEPTGEEFFPVPLPVEVLYASGSGGSRIGTQFTIATGVSTPATVNAVRFQLKGGSFANATGFKLYRSDPQDAEVDIAVAASSTTITGDKLTIILSSPYTVTAQSANFWQLRYTLTAAGPIHVGPYSMFCDVGTGVNDPALTDIHEWAWNITAPRTLSDELLGPVSSMLKSADIRLPF